MKKNNLFLKSFVNSLFFKNPVLSLFMGLTLVVIATTRVEIALIISLIVLVDLLLSNIIISLLRKYLGKISSYILDTIISATVAVIFSILIDRLIPGFLNAEESKYSLVLFGVIPFISTNSIAIAKCEDDLERGFVETLGDAIGSAISFLVVTVVIALIREILISGSITWTLIDGKIAKWTLWDSKVFSISIMSNPFGGILLVGMFSGIHLYYVNKVKSKQKLEEAK